MLPKNNGSLSVIIVVLNENNFTDKLFPCQLDKIISILVQYSIAKSKCITCHCVVNEYPVIVFVHDIKIFGG